MPRLDHLLCLDLYATSRAVIKAYRPLLEPLGLTYPQYLVMVALWEQEPLGVKELSQRLNLDSGTLSPLLKRLEAAGLISRTRSTTDEREVKITLTSEGKALRKNSESVFKEMGCLFALDTAGVKQLQVTLREISERMEHPES